MLSHLKLRTLFIAILTILSVLVLSSALSNRQITNAVSENFHQLESLAVSQASNLRLTQISALRMMSNIYGASLVADMAERRAEVNSARQLGRQAQAYFAKFAEEAAETEFGQSTLVKIRPPFERLMQALENMAKLIESRDDDAGMNRLRYTEAMPANHEFTAVMNEFGIESDKIVATVKAEQESMRTVSNVLLPTFIVLLIGVIGGTMVFLSRHVLQPLRQANQLFDGIASGDLTQRVMIASKNEIGQLFQSLARMQDSLRTTVMQVRNSVDEINVGVGEIAAGNADLSGRTESQAASLEETAASMTELASTVKQNADNARQANQLAASASDVAERGGQVVSEVVDTMSEISTKSHKISEIVTVIDGIAFQTNILALNAAVEAARAGEQGKGFAVVAGEVRALAQKSAQAAKEIKTLIEDSANRVEAGTHQVERAGMTMHEIVDSVRRVTAIMSEISVASQEQASGIDQVNQAVSKMDEVTQQNAALVEEAAAAALSLKEQSHQLVQAVAIFKTQGDVYLDAPTAKTSRVSKPSARLIQTSLQAAEAY